MARSNSPWTIYRRCCAAGRGAGFVLQRLVLIQRLLVVTECRRVVPQEVRDVAEIGVARRHPRRIARLDKGISRVGEGCDGRLGVAGDLVDEACVEEAPA